MIIEKSNIQMASSHTYQEQTTHQQSLRISIGGPLNLLTPVNQQQSTADSSLADTLELSEQSRQLTATEEKSGEEFQITSIEDAKIRALQAMIEAFTGKKIRFLILNPGKQEESADLQTKLRNLASVNVPSRVGWSLDYRSSSTHSETETISYHAAGIVKTADGREIDLSLELNMSRSFYSRQEIHLQAGNMPAIDPLVINFDAPAAQLTTTKFSFDLDADGTADQISFAGPGSGFLALDLNGDGQINDGQELFGPQTGNGFTELARYDSDGNNWIDENDPIWDQLRIWTKDSNGNDVLFALGQKGIGAIYLGNVSTEFALKDADNKQHGQLRNTGLFLHENGTPGTVQQVDLIG